MWLLRLPPIVFLILAPIGLVLAIYLYVTDQTEEAQKARALAGRPPAEVPVEAFNRDRNMGPGHEAVVLAQIDPSKLIDVTRTKRGVVRERWMITPLYPTTANSASVPAPGVLMQRGAISDAQLLALVVRQGAFGPIVRLNGRVLDESPTDSTVSTGLRGAQLTATPVFIDPFEAGRQAGLAPSGDGAEAAWVVGILSLILGAYGLIRQLMRSRRAEMQHADHAHDGHSHAPGGHGDGPAQPNG